jgi:uncharacterized protein
MDEIEDLLWQVFEQLRRQGVPIGVSEYLEAITTIQAGFKAEEMCRLLWAKSQEDQELFDRAFQELVEPQLQNTSTELTSSAHLTSSSKDTPPSSTASSISSSTTSQSQSQDRQTTVTSSVETQTQSLNLPFESPTATRRYQMTPRLPMSIRDMAGAWRQLRRPQRVGVPEELDVEATINTICHTGLLIYPVFQPRRRNQARLVLLVDSQGSMTPFRLLIDALIESVLRGGLSGKTNLYYFHDCPEELLYQNPNLIRAIPLEVVLNEEVKGNSVLIVSDAGAARGYYDGRRVQDTKKFLQTLKDYTYLYAWLNPMPKNRWEATTAEDIACQVPMFPLNREGLNDTVNILRGFPFPAGVSSNE